jgi:dipeptidyl aminopeptidase/acylaminoacyl peptidase
MILLAGNALDAELAYQKPPQAILDVLNAPPTPHHSVSPDRTHVLLAQWDRYPSIAVLSQPMLRLAGLRINPQTNGPHSPVSNSGFTLKRLSDGKETKIALPPGAELSAPFFSADGKHFAFSNTTKNNVELWVAETASGKAKQISGVALNCTYGQSIQWMPDNRTLLIRMIPSGRGAVPVAQAAPAGPNVQESKGKAGPVRTYQDMLTSPHDEALFDYYVTAQNALVDIASGKITPVGKPGIFAVNEPSPDGKYLLISRILHPYSYVHTLFAFPKSVEVWDMSGRTVHAFPKLSLEDRVPIGGVAVGPRSFNWCPTASATLFWVEALDGGNPNKAAAHRDRLITLKAPFSEKPVEIYQTVQRFSGIQWSEESGVVIVRDYDRDKRWSTSTLLNLNSATEAPRTLWSRNIQDAYSDPGLPVLRTLASGQPAVRQIGSDIFLHGDGATPSGDRPFLRRYNLKTGKSEALFRSSETSFEEFVALIAEDGSEFITQRQSPTEPPNYYLHSTAGVKKITDFKDPAPQLRTIKKQLVTYKRADGVPLSFTLYLPPDYKPGTALPTVVWAYPREFNDAETAGQVVGSTQRFTSIAGISHLFLLLSGYAILDNAGMPVVGTPEKANDTYIEQIVMDAKAAIDKAVEMGVTDRKRVGVGGHSYGAFMTANLLAHSDLFRAGIARSGAYNRTLTPFGFQSERRTLWEAPEIYLKMSPFMNANKINEPILLIHGEADNNPGTFPIQSDRLYQAIRGNGGTVRYVTLPFESHGYTARESVEHTLWEMISWFDKYVKAEARP